MQKNTRYPDPTSSVPTSPRWRNTRRSSPSRCWQATGKETRRDRQARCQRESVRAVAAVREALSQFPWYHIYPDPQQHELREALADYSASPPSTSCPATAQTNCSDYLCRLFLLPGDGVNPGDSIINCPPTFGMYSFDALLSGGRVIDVWRDEDPLTNDPRSSLRAGFRLDVQAIERAVLDAEPSPKTPLPHLAQQPRRWPDPSRCVAPSTPIATDGRRG